MAKTKVSGLKAEIGAALSKDEVDDINNAASDAARITIFDTQTPYVNIPEIEMVGNFGIQQNIITAVDLTTSLVQKDTSTKDGGDFELTLFFDSASAVIQTIRQGVIDGFNFPFKITPLDKGPDVGSSSTVFYLAGILAGFNIEFGDVSSFIKVKTTLALNTIPFYTERD